MKNFAKPYIIALVFACFVPEVFLFTDTYLLPKWYSVISLLLVGIIVFVLKSKCKAESIDSCNASYFFKTFENSIAIVPLCQSMYIVCQLFIRGYIVSGEIGTFDTSAGLACCIAICIPFAVTKFRNSTNKYIKATYLVIIALYAVTIILSKSRAGILCVFLYAIIYSFRFIKMHMWIKSTICVIICIIAIVCLAQFKTNSTAGRYFILSNTVDLIKEHPWVGYGNNVFEKMYMLKQAEYFLNNETSKYARLADEINHPLNEFVYLWTNYGIIAPVILCSTFVIPFIVYIKRKDLSLENFLLSLLAVFVFSCLSYPFHYPLSWIVLIAALLKASRHHTKHFKTLKDKTKLCLCYIVVSLSAITLATVCFDAFKEYQWNQAWKHLRHKETGALGEYANLETYFSSNKYFLYNYAMASFLAKDYDKAYSLIEKCGSYWNGYNRELLCGDICFNREDYSSAIKHYSMAKLMCPVRFAPLEGMYKVYAKVGNEKKKAFIAEEITKKDIKIYSSDIIRIKENCK